MDIAVDIRFGLAWRSATDVFLDLAERCEAVGFAHQGRRRRLDGRGGQVKGQVSAGAGVMTEYAPLGGL